jgi:hypothetical protein
MRQILGILVAVFVFSSTANAQQINVNGYQQILNPVDNQDIPVALKAIQFKKYLSKDFKPAHIDDFDQKAFLRYNIHEDQMEFVKGNNTYYLKKDVGRKVRFDNNQTYVVHELDGELHFFLAHVDGKNKLLARQIVKFVEARKAETAYDRDKPADYKRKRDELYISVDGKALEEAPRRKKDFYALFGDKASTVKKFMKKNRLGHKKDEDLIKIIEFTNSL